MNKTYQIIWEGLETKSGAHYDKGDIIRTCATSEEAEMRLSNLFDDFKTEAVVAFSIKTIFSPDKK